MSELEQAIAILRERGATEADVAEYTRQYMGQMGSRPDATSALQHERENPTGDWEAIPDGLKTAAGIGLSMLPIGGGAMMAGKGIARAAPVAGAVAAEMPLIRNIVRGVRAGRKAYQAGKAIEKIVPKAEGLMGPESSIASERVALAPRRVQSMQERIAQMAEPVEQSSNVPGLMTPESTIASERVALSPRRVQTLEERLAQMAEPAEQPATLEGFLGNSIDNLPHAGSARSAGPARSDPLVRQLEELIEDVASRPQAAGWKPRGATKGRFDWFAEQQAKRQAAPTIEEVLGADDLTPGLQMTLEHIKKGGSMKSAADALKLVRRQ
jgi:hypothetical protein